MISLCDIYVGYFIRYANSENDFEQLLKVVTSNM